MKYVKKRNIIIAGIIFLLGILIGGKVLINKEIIFKGEEYFKVIEVIDGDTIVINEKLKVKNEKLNDKNNESENDTDNRQLVRLLSINAPEKNTCYYVEAKQALEDLVLNKTVRLEKDVSDKDKFDRWLRYIVLPSIEPDEDDLLVNDYLVREGYVLAEPYEPDVRHRKLLYEAQDEAVDNNRRIWAVCDYAPINETDNELDLPPEREDCIIKGNVTRGADAEKIYFLPHCQNYDRVKIDPRKGDGWFCTEAEALAAGFRKVGNCE